MKKYLSYVPKTGYITKAKRCCANHPVIATLAILLAVAALVFTIIAIVKLVSKDEDLLDDEWNLDDEDDALYFYPSEDDFVEGE